MDAHTPTNLVWVTGAGGLIGNTLVETAAQFAPGWLVKGLRRGDIDLADFRAVADLHRREQPSLIIHCAALSRGPACEADPALAKRLNVGVTEFLGGLCAESDFIHFSTDLVFDGKKGNYSESDPVNPLSVYAETKVAAEQAVSGNPRHTIIRTSLNGGKSPTGDRGFNEELRRQWSVGKATRLFSDEYRSPIPALATARAVWELARAGARGIYHVGGSERLSRFEIGLAVAELCPELNPKIEACSLATHQGPPRPPDTSLNCAKAQGLLAFPLPRFRDWLRAHPDRFF